jgi:hypothetical protein
MGVTRGKRDALRLRTERGLVRGLHHETVHAEQFLPTNAGGAAPSSEMVDGAAGAVVCTSLSGRQIAASLLWSV